MFLFCSKDGLSAVWGSKYDGQMFKWKHVKPKEYKENDVVCDECINKWLCNQLIYYDGVPLSVTCCECKTINNLILGTIIHDGFSCNVYDNGKLYKMNHKSFVSPLGNTPGEWLVWKDKTKAINKPLCDNCIKKLLDNNFIEKLNENICYQEENWDEEIKTSWNDPIGC